MSKESKDRGGSGSPIVIGGVQRSGTSMLRAIMGSNKEVAIFPYDIPLFNRVYESVSGGPMTYSGCISMVDSIYSNKKLKKAEEVSNIPNKSEILSRLEKGGGAVDAFRVIEVFLEEYAKRNGGARWGLKRPRIEFYAEEIINKCNANVLHIIRDPRDVQSSLQNYEGIDFNISINPWRHTTSKKSGGERRRWIEEWKESTKNGIYNEKKYPKNYKIVKYERLTSNTVEAVEDLCEFCGLTYSEEMCKMSDQPGWENDNSSFGDIKRGIKRNIRYKKYTSNYVVGYIERELEGEMGVLGYKLEEKDYSSMESIIRLNSKIGNYIESLKDKIKGSLKS